MTSRADPLAEVVSAACAGDASAVERLVIAVQDGIYGLALRMLKVMANRLHMSGQRESALAFMNAQARLARFLLELEEQEQDKGYVTISQEELAHRAGLHRTYISQVERAVKSPTFPKKPRSGGRR